MEGEVITDIILGWREFTFTFLNLVGFYSSYTMYYNVIQYMQCNTGVSQVLINSCQGLFSTHLQVMDAAAWGHPGGIGWSPQRCPPSLLLRFWMAMPGSPHVDSLVKMGKHVKLSGPFSRKKALEVDDCKPFWWVYNFDIIWFDIYIYMRYYILYYIYTIYILYCIFYYI